MKKKDQKVKTAKRALGRLRCPPMRVIPDKKKRTIEKDKSRDIE